MDLELPILGPLPPQAQVSVAAMYDESARWLELPWVQDRLLARWESLASRVREPFTLNPI